MNTSLLKTHHRNLLAIAAMSISLVLAPMTAIAGDGDRHHKKHSYSNKHAAKHHNKSHFRSDKHAHRKHARNHHNNLGHGFKKKHRKHYGKHHRPYYKHAYNYPRYRRHHDHHGHTRYIVNDYGHRGHYYDHLRFMIGLHTDNFDITFHD